MKEGDQVIIWFIEVPIILLLAAGLLLIVLAKTVATTALAAGLYLAAGLLAVGVVMMVIAFVLFWVTVVMQHRDEQKTNKIDRIMKGLGVRGAILSAVGFLAHAALHTELLPMWLKL